MEDSIKIILFCSFYFAFITIVLSMINPAITCNKDNCSGNDLSTVGIDKIGINISLGNFITNFEQLGAWNLLIFSPFIIVLIYIGLGFVRGI